MLQEEKQGVPPQEKLSIVSVTIPTAEISEDQVVYYHLHVFGSFNSWAVAKRYSAFEELNNRLMAEFAHKPLPKGLVLPPKKLKLLANHLSKSFIEERRVLLSNYINKLVNHKEACKSETFLNFLTSDKRPDIAVEEKDDPEMPEDVEVTGVQITSTRVMSDHVLYQIDVCNARKRKTFSKWTVLKRFGQFYDMDHAVRQQYQAEPEFLAGLPNPPERRSKLVHDHMDSAFIEERRALLEHYLQQMLRVPRIVRDPIFLHFLGVNV